MRRLLQRVLMGAVLVSFLTMAPTPAYADVGSTIVGRLWDSMLSTLQHRLQSNAPNTVRVLQEAERVFLGGTEDITTNSAVRDVFNGMRVAGLLLLGLCTVISLAQMAEAGMMGQSTSLMEWMQRFCVATFMTMGGIHFYGIWTRIFNGLLTLFRDYLDTHWTDANDSGSMFLKLVSQVDPANSMLLMTFGVIMLVVLFVLWFLIGGIRTAELAISVMIAPLVWPAYLIPSLEDIPKTAFRSFLGLNAVLLVITGMLRLSVRMVAGGAVVNTVWNWVPAIAMLMLTIFLPSMIKRLVGQGNTGAGGLMTLVSFAAGLKGLNWAVAGGARPVSPPATASIPAAPTSPSAYPVAPIASSGVAASRAQPSGGPPMYETWVESTPALQAGSNAHPPAVEAPFTPVAGKPVEFEMGRADPGSNSFVIIGMRAYEKGLSRTHPIKDITPGREDEDRDSRREELDA